MSDLEDRGLRRQRTARLGRHVPICHRQASAVWLRLVGSFEVRRAGEPLTGTSVGNRKARTLLALLAVRRASLIPVETIVDNLWDDGWPRDPAAGGT